MKEDKLSSNYDKAMSLLSDKEQNNVLVISVAVHHGHRLQFDEDSRLWNTHEKAIWKEWLGLAKDETEDWKQVHGSVRYHPTIQN